VDLQFFVDKFTELHDRFPVVSQWFDNLATHPAFISGVQKVALHNSAADSCSNSCSNVRSNVSTKAAQSFLTNKWKVRRSRPKTLWVIYCFAWYVLHRLLFCLVIV